MFMLSDICVINKAKEPNRTGTENRNVQSVVAYLNRQNANSGFEWPDREFERVSVCFRFVLAIVNWLIMHECCINGKYLGCILGVAQVEKLSLCQILKFCQNLNFVCGNVKSFFF